MAFAAVATSRLATATALAMAFAAVATTSRLATATTLAVVASAAIATSRLATASALAAAGAFGALVGCGSHRTSLR